MTVVRPFSQWGVAVLGEDDRVEAFEEKPRLDHWINGGFFCFEPGALSYMDEASVLEQGPLRALAADGELHAFRHPGFWDCMDTYKDAVTLNDLWGDRARHLGPCGSADPRDPVPASSLVTGGRGFVGAWLCRALLERGDRVVSLDRPATRSGGPRRSGSWGSRASWRASTGDLLDGDQLVPGAGREHDVDTVFHLGAETIVGTVRRLAGARRSRRTSAARGPCSRPAARQGVERVVVASSDKAYGAHDELPYREDFPLQPTAPYEASKAAADLIARCYWPSYGLPVAVTRFANIYGGGDLNFSRLDPEAVCAALDGRRAGAPLRRLARARLPLRRGRRARLSGDRRRPRPRRGPRRGVQRRRRASLRASGRSSRSIARLAGTGVEPDVRGDRQPGGRDRPPVRRPGEDAGALAGWEPQVGLEDGLRRTIEWYREHRECAAPEPAG